MKIVSLYSGERLDLADLIYATADTPRQAQTDISAGLLTRGDPRVVSGFVTTYSGTVVSVAAGSALLTYKQGSAISRGLFVGADAGGQSFDCKGLAAGTYGVWVTFVSQPTEPAERTAYASAGTGFDQDSIVNTRQAATWGLKIAVAQPGAEYLKVAEVALPAGTVTDARPLLFEGNASDSFAPTWGTDEDRAAARGDNPITDLETMIAALKVAIEDVKGARWYERTSGGGGSGGGSGGGGSGGTTSPDGASFAYSSTDQAYEWKGPGGSPWAVLDSAGLTLKGGVLTFPDGTTMSTAASDTAKLVDDLVANSLVLAPVSGDTNPSQLLIKNSAGNTVFAADTDGNTQVAGTFNVGGLATLNTLNAGNITVANQVTTADHRVGGKLTVMGSTTLADATATNLTVNSTLQASAATIGGLSTGTVSAQGEVSTKDLTATGLSTLSALTATSLQVGTKASPGSTKLFGPVTVVGDTTLADADIQGLTAQSALIAGDVTAAQADITGPITGEALTLTLPSTGAAGTPLQVNAADGTELLGLTSQGNLAVHGTLTVAGAQTNDATNAGALTATSFIDHGNAVIEGTLTVDGQTTLGTATAAALTAQQAEIDGPLKVTGDSTLATLEAQATTVTDLTASGNTALAKALSVQGDTTLAGLTAGSVSTGGLTASGNAELGALTVDGASRLHATTTDALTVGGNLNVSGTGTFGSDLSTQGGASAASLNIAAKAGAANSTPVLVVDSSGNTLMSLDLEGDLVVRGGLTVNGSQADTATNVGALTASSITDNGNATIKGDLSVAGHTTLADTTLGGLTASSITDTGSLSVTGASTLSGGLNVGGNTTTGSLSTHAISVTYNQSSPGTLDVSGITHLGETHTGELTASSGTVSGSLAVSGGLSVSGQSSLSALSVSGQSSLQNVGMAALTAASANVTGSQNIGQTLNVGQAVNAAALALTLPATGGTTTPMTVTDSTGKSLLSLDNMGDLTVAGTLTLTGNQTGQANNLGAVTVTSFSDLGNAIIQGTLTVNGATSLADLSASGSTTLGATTVGALTADSLAVAHNGTFGGTLGVTGATTLGSTTTGALAASGLSVAGNGSVGGTFGVTGKTTLGVAQTGALTAASLNVTGNELVGGTLGVTGAVTMASTLGVIGSTTFGSTVSVSGTTTTAALSVSLPATGGAAKPFLITKSDGTNLLTFDTSGNLVITGNLTQAGGGSSGGSSSFGDVTVTSLTDTGNATVAGTLNVSGATTLAGLSVSSFNNSGNSKAASLTLQLPSSGAAAIPLQLLASDSTSLFSVNNAGNMAVKGSTSLAAVTASGTLQVTGATTLAATTTAALTAASVAVTNNATVGGTLTVNGNTTFANVSTGALTAASLSVTNNASVGGTFSVTGATTLAATSLSALTAASAAISGNTTVGGTFGVTGATTLAATTTAALTASAATINGNATVGGTLGISGATTTAALTVALPSSGASATPITLNKSDGTNLLSVDGSGNLTIAGTLTSASGSSANNQLGNVTVTSLTDTGNATIAGTLSVGGATTLAGLSVTSFSNSGNSQAASLTIQLPSSGAAATPLQLLSSGGTKLFAADSSGNVTVAGSSSLASVTASGTLGVTGATSLSTLSTSGLATLSALTVSGNATLQSALSVAGLATLNGGANVNGNATVSGSVVGNVFQVTGAGNATNPAFAYYGQFRGAGTTYATGISFDATFGGLYEYTGGYAARSILYPAPPRDNGAGWVTHTFNSSVTGTTAAQVFKTGNGNALIIYGNNNINTGNALTVAGLTTSAGVTLSSGSLTFADGSSLSSAPATPNVGSSARFGATAVGSAASPAFYYSGATNGSGLFFDGAAGNVVVSANGAKTLFTRAASGAAVGASGVGVASTLGTGAQVFGVYGNGVDSTTPANAQFTIDGIGSVKAANVTLSANGVLTFGDGTTMQTAATGGSGSTTGGLVSGQGAPTSTYPSGQADGFFYIDTINNFLYGPRANSVWPSPISIIGPAGPAGFTSLPNASVVPGPTVLINNLTVSSTTQVIPVPGTTNIPQTYFPQGPSALMGVGVFTSGVACTIELYDQTLSKSIYTQSIPANTYSNTGVFGTTQYPMVSSNQHVWRVTGSGSVSANIQPYYLSASTTNTPCLSTVGGFTTAAGTAFSSTAIDIVSFGQTSAKQRNVVFVRTASLVGLTGIYVPSAAGAATASVTITVGSYNYSSGVATTLFTTTTSLTNNSVTTILGQWTPGTYTFAPGTLLYMRVQGSGTGQVNVDAQVVM